MTRKPYRLTDRSLSDPTYVLASAEFDTLEEATAEYEKWAEAAARNGGDIRLEGPDGVIAQAFHLGVSE